MFNVQFHSPPPIDIRGQNMASVKIRLRELMHEKTLRDGRDPESNPITQIEVAQAIGVANGTLGSWARNTVEKLDKNMLADLCKYLGCRVQDLIVIEE